MPPPLCGGDEEQKMSNVFLRKRADTELTFMTTGRQLQNELTKYVMREKVMPKKWRYMIGRTLIAKVDEMMDNIVAANSIYVLTERDLEVRKEFQAKAIYNCFQIQSKLLRMIDCVDTVTVKSLTPAIKLLNKEVATLKNWKKSTKIAVDKK